jgi:hypothetical protein
VDDLLLWAVVILAGRHRSSPDGMSENSGGQASCHTPGRPTRQNPLEPCGTSRFRDSALSGRGAVFEDSHFEADHLRVSA